MLRYCGLTPRTSVSLTTPPPKLMRVVHLENRRGVNDARNLGIDGFLIVAGEGVVVEHAVGAGGSAARVLHLDVVGADLLESSRG